MTFSSTVMDVEHAHELERACDAEPRDAVGPARRDVCDRATGWRRRRAVSAPEIRLSIVVLPEPFGPIRPTISPRSTSNDTSSTATRPPNALRRFAIVQRRRRSAAIAAGPASDGTPERRGPRSNSPTTPCGSEVDDQQNTTPSRIEK